MPVLEWSVAPVAAGMELRRVGGASDTDTYDPVSPVLGAAFAVEGLHYLADLHASVAIWENRPVLGHPAQNVDLAYARWALVDAITAIDLACAALGRVRRTHPHAKSKREMDFGIAQSKLLNDPQCGWWVHAVKADPEYAALKTLRDVMVHRVASKHATVSVRTGKVVRGWAEPGGPPMQDAVVRARDFATRHIEAFLQAASTGRLS